MTPYLNKSILLYWALLRNTVISNSQQTEQRSLECYSIVKTYKLNTGTG